MVWSIYRKADNENSRGKFVCYISIFHRQYNSSADTNLGTDISTLTPQVFTKDSFELRTVTNKHLGLQADKGLAPKERKNYVLGTDNKWKYSSFVNWDFFPSVDLPILVYFKETQTPKVNECGCCYVNCH